MGKKRKRGEIEIENERLQKKEREIMRKGCIKSLIVRKCKER